MYVGNQCLQIDQAPRTHLRTMMVPKVQTPNGDQRSVEEIVVDTEKKVEAGTATGIVGLLLALGLFGATR